MQTTLSLQNPVTIRSYFEKILELRKSGEEYPVSLDDVWALAYSRKDAALRALGEIFVKGLDYQIFHQNVEKSSRGRKQDIYKLSVSCLEYLVARKVREVFEVYRQVFHTATEAVKQVVQPAVEKLQNRVKYLEAKLASNELAHRNEIKTLQFRLTANQGQLEFYQNHSKDLEEYWRKAEERYFKESDRSFVMLEELLDLRKRVIIQQVKGESQSSLPPLSGSTQINRLVHSYAANTGRDYPSIYHWIYQEMEYRYHIAPLKWKLAAGASRIAEVEKRGYIDKMLAIAEHLLLPAQVA